MNPQDIALLTAAAEYMERLAAAIEAAAVRAQKARNHTAYDMWMHHAGRVESSHFYLAGLLSELTREPSH